MSQKLEEARKDFLEYTLEVSESFSTIFAPLAAWGIDWCTHAKHFLNEEQQCYRKFLIQTHPQAHRWVCESVFNNGPLFIEAIQETRLGAVNYFLNPLSSHDYILEAYREQFGLKAGLTIFVRHASYIEAWDFRSTQMTSALSRCTLNHAFIDAIDRFVKQLRVAYAALNLDESKGIFFEKTLDYREIEKPNYDAVFSALQEPSSSGLKVGGHAVWLSPQEMKCSKAWALGHTAKEIARQLGISHRTVEEYLAHAKKKLGLGSKAEMIRFFHEYNFSNQGFSG